jgi:tRNA-dihydrouridine synthase 4
MAGVAWITVHGRTKHQRSSAPCDFDAVKAVCLRRMNNHVQIKEIANVPIFANGQCFSLSDAERWKSTGVDGIMSARGILENPALFKGFDVTPPEVVSEWTSLALNYGVPTHIFHQHLMMMLYKVHNKEGMELVVQD